MQQILKLALNICILIIVYSLCTSITEGNKSGIYIKNAMGLLIVLTVANFVSNFDFKKETEFNIQEYKIDYSDVWDSTLLHLEQKLSDDMLAFVKSNGLDVTDVQVKLKTDYEGYEVEAVEIHGVDSRSAKNLIAGYFQIGTAYINIDGV